jgi:hypothetical protein
MDVIVPMTFAAASASEATIDGLPAKASSVISARKAVAVAALGSSSVVEHMPDGREWGEAAGAETRQNRDM